MSTEFNKCPECGSDDLEYPDIHIGESSIRCASCGSLIDTELVIALDYKNLIAERDALKAHCEKLGKSLNEATTDRWKLETQLEKCEKALEFYYNDDIYVGGPNLEDSARNYFKEKGEVE